MRPLSETDGYLFQWPDLSNEVARNFIARFTDSLIDLTPAQRVEKIDAWLPALRNEAHAAKHGISAADQHIVVTTLMTWREDNLDRVSQ